MNVNSRHRHRLLAFGLAASLVVLAVACGSGGGGSSQPSAALPTITPRPASTATPISTGLRTQAEQHYLAQMSQALQDLIRAQPWYQEMTPTKLIMVNLLLQAEQAARAKGEPRSMAEMLQFASEQGWYKDGLDDHEASGLGGIFLAYKTSLSKDDAPPVGTTVSTTIQYQLFNTVTLPETGNKVIIVASKDVKLGQRALQIASENMAKVESVVGKFPYPFLYIEVTPDLPEEILGLSYDEFIGVRSDSVDPETIVHEITHSTVYGLFPIWFEEGLAHFMEYYVNNKLERGATDFTSELRAIRADSRLDIRAFGFYTLGDYIAERAQGFLFLKGLYDIEGIDGLGKTIRTLRTKTYNDQELLAQIMQLAPDNLQTQMRKFYCDRVIGLSHNYCVPGG